MVEPPSLYRAGSRDPTGSYHAAREAHASVCQVLLPPHESPPEATRLSLDGRDAMGAGAAEIKLVDFVSKTAVSQSVRITRCEDESLVRIDKSCPIYATLLVKTCL